MTWGWQQAVTLALIAAAVIYLTRHVLRTMTREPGAGCGVSSGCGGCSSKTGATCNQPIMPGPPPAPGATRSE
jgi:FeoB-associated Cys-rich membrane protein